MVAAHGRWLAKCCAAGALLGTAPTAGAQGSDSDPLFWAYAVAAGSGVYRLGDGGDSQSYRANFSVKLRDSDEAFGVRLLLPAAIGVENLDNDIRPLERGADLEHAAFLPGIELEHDLGERWTLRSRAQLGYGEEHSDIDLSARIAALGVRGRMTFEDASGKPSLISGLLWTGYDPSVGERGSLLRFTLGVELDIRAARWRVRDSPMRWRPHVLKDWYYRPPPALAYGDDEFERLDEEWQLGVAAAREGGFKIWFFKFEAVGVAYRFAEYSEGLRFYLNSVF